MSYAIEAFAAKERLLRKHSPGFRNAYVVPLAHGFALLPMIGALYHEINQQAPERGTVGLYGFELLSPALASWAQQLSRDEPVAYFEAEYFSGIGGQRAILWQDGVIAAGSDGSLDIDCALRMLGVKRSGDTDEFDIIGLGKYRETQKWAASAIVENFQEKATTTITGLVEALHFEHGSKSLRSLVHEFAAHRLCTIGKEARQALHALVQCASTDDDYGVRLEACCALAAIGPEAVQPLAHLLTASDANDRWSAAFALSKLGPSAKNAVPALMGVMTDPDHRVRSQAAETLGEIGPEAHPAIAPLMQALKDSEWTVRSEAAKALGKIGSDAREAVSALRKASRDRDEFVRQASDEALRKITGFSGLP